MFALSLIDNAESVEVLDALMLNCDKVTPCDYATFAHNLRINQRRAYSRSYNQATYATAQKTLLVRTQTEAFECISGKIEEIEDDYSDVYAY